MSKPRSEAVIIFLDWRSAIAVNIPLPNFYNEIAHFSFVSCNVYVFLRIFSNDCFGCYPYLSRQALEWSRYYIFGLAEWHCSKYRPSCIFFSLIFYNECYIYEITHFSFAFCNVYVIFFRMIIQRLSFIFCELILLLYSFLAFCIGMYLYVCHGGIGWSTTRSIIALQTFQYLSPCSPANVNLILILLKIICENIFGLLTHVLGPPVQPCPQK